MYMAVTALQKKKYTYQDYQRTPDDKRFELIIGDLIMTPSPVPKHQTISKRIEFMLEEFVVENNLGEVFYAPCDIHLDDDNVVQPDILFISKERINIIGEKNIQGAPDLAIEILSDTSAYRDMVLKKKLYAKFGVHEYWIVIPEEESIEIYTLKNNIYELYKAYRNNDVLESPYIKNLKIELAKIF